MGELYWMAMELKHWNAISDSQVLSLQVAWSRSRQKSTKHAVPGPWAHHMEYISPYLKLPDHGDGWSVANELVVGRYPVCWYVLMVSLDIASIALCFVVLFTYPYPRALKYLFNEGNKLMFHGCEGPQKWRCHYVELLDRERYV